MLSSMINRWRKRRSARCPKLVSKCATGVCVSLKNSSSAGDALTVTKSPAHKERRYCALLVNPGAAFEGIFKMFASCCTANRLSQGCATIYCISYNRLHLLPIVCCIGEFHSTNILYCLYKHHIAQYIVLYFDAVGYVNSSENPR